MSWEQFGALWILAQSAEVIGKMDWVAPFVQLVTAGGFGSLVWYFIVKHIPAIEARHAAERLADEVRWTAERGEWLGYIEKRDKQFEQQAKDFTDAMIKMESFLLRSQRDSHEQS